MDSPSTLPLYSSEFRTRLRLRVDNVLDHLEEAGNAVEVLKKEIKQMEAELADKKVRARMLELTARKTKTADDISKSEEAKKEKEDLREEIHSKLDEIQVIDDYCRDFVDKQPGWTEAAPPPDSRLSNIFKSPRS